MFDNILVVCVGNVCRSPTAERILQKKLPNKAITSAGIAVEKSHLVGHAADAMASSMATESNYDLSGHQAKQLTTQMCQSADLILVMEHGHLEAISKMAPEVRGKVMLLGHWLDQAEVPDPYKKSREAFAHAFQLIEQCSDSWCKKL